jgi:hypothetical protein
MKKKKTLTTCHLKKINNHTIKNLNDSKEVEIANIELKRMTRMISEIKEDLYKHSMNSKRIQIKN